MGKQKEVIDEFSSLSEDDVDLIAVVSLAKYTLGKKEEAVSSVESLIADSKDNHNVQYIGGIILALENRLDEALELLSLHQGSLEAISLIVQIYLIQNQLDAAFKEVQAAKKWAQDNVVFNLSEAWVDFRKGGIDRYQDGFYIYEELASGGSTTIKSLLGQIVSQLQLGRLPEAEISLSQALELDPKNPDVLISLISLAILSGKSYEEHQRYDILTILFEK